MVNYGGLGPLDGVLLVEEIRYVQSEDSYSTVASYSAGLYGWRWAVNVC